MVYCLNKIKPLSIKNKTKHSKLKTSITPYSNNNSATHYKEIRWGGADLIGSKLSFKYFLERENCQN